MAGKRSDPVKLAADAAAIGRSQRSFRSRAKAQADADAFKATGEGTLPEAFQHLFDEAADRRYLKRFGGPPSKAGATQSGFGPPDNAA